MNLSQALQESMPTAPFITAQIASVDDTGLYTLTTPGRAVGFPGRSIVEGGHMIGDWVVVHVCGNGAMPSIIGDSPFATG